MGPAFARLVACASLLFLCAVLLAVVALIAEALASLSNSAEWASAIGGFLAVAAAALIAIRQSAQVRLTLDRQSVLHKEALARQEKLQAEMLDHQVKLQHEVFEQQNRLEAARNAEAHARAVGASKVVFEMVHNFVKVMNEVKAWGKPFHQVHTPILMRASSILDAISHSSFRREEDIISFGKFTYAFSNVVRDFNDLCDVNETDPKELSRYWVKDNFRSMRIFLEQIDPNWDADSIEAETPTEIENRAYTDLHLTTYPNLR